MSQCILYEKASTEDSISSNYWSDNHQKQTSDQLQNHGTPLTFCNDCLGYMGNINAYKEITGASAAIFSCIVSEADNVAIWSIGKIQLSVCKSA